MWPRPKARVIMEDVIIWSSLSTLLSSSFSFAAPSSLSLSSFVSTSRVRFVLYIALPEKYEAYKAL